MQKEVQNFVWTFQTQVSKSKRAMYEIICSRLLNYLKSMLCSIHSTSFLIDK